MRFSISMLEKDKVNMQMSRVNEAKLYRKKNNKIMRSEPRALRKVKIARKATRFRAIAFIVTLKDSRILVKYPKNRHNRYHLNR